VNLRFLTSAGQFLELAGDLLRNDPVVTNVVGTVASRAVAQEAAGALQPAEDWWLVVTDDQGEVVGAGMRTAPFAPRPLFLLPMPDEAALALARELHRRGEEVLAVNGALPAAQLCAQELARLRGEAASVTQHTRLHEVVEVIPPRPTPGRLVVATEAHLDLVRGWFEAFGADADEQAGRPPGSSAHSLPDDEDLRRRTRDGLLHLWQDDTSRFVHLTGTNPPASGVARIGPVYTPAQERGRGWASSAVAEVSRRLLGSGARVCLFTDQANPTSNRLYADLGYRPVVDMANFGIGPASQGEPRGA
jgi:hypothetical protein